MVSVKNVIISFHENYFQNDIFFLMRISKPVYPETTFESRNFSKNEKNKITTLYARIIIYLSVLFI